MKPVNNPVFEIEIVKDSSGYHCNASYDAVMNTVKEGGHVSGWYVEKTTGTGRTGASVSPIIAVALQTLNSKLAFRYQSVTFNAQTGAVSGSISTVYMATDGTISTTA